MDAVHVDVVIDEAGDEELGRSYLWLVLHHLRKLVLMLSEKEIWMEMMPLLKKKRCERHDTNEGE